MNLRTQVLCALAFVLLLELAYQWKATADHNSPGPTKSGVQPQNLGSPGGSRPQGVNSGSGFQGGGKPQGLNSGAGFQGGGRSQGLNSSGGFQGNGKTERLNPTEGLHGGEKLQGRVPENKKDNPNNLSRDNRDSGGLIRTSGRSLSTVTKDASRNFDTHN